jgi:opacity protein-like surface antigen
MQKRWLFLALATLGHDAAAKDSSEEFYASVGGGINRLYDSDIAGGFVEHRYSDGWSGIGSLGYAFANGIRTEFEVGYRRNTLDSVNTYGSSSAGIADDQLSGTGHVAAWTFIGNILYEYANESSFSPYIGGGMGLAALHYNNAAGHKAGHFVVPVHGDESAPAAQAIAGIDYKLSENLRVFVDYRYLTALGPKTFFGDNPETDVEYDTSTILVGLRVPLGD